MSKSTSQYYVINTIALNKTTIPKSSITPYCPICHSELQLTQSSDKSEFYGCNKCNKIQLHIKYIEVKSTNG